jgi:hypothetical protein
MKLIITEKKPTDTIIRSSSLNYGEAQGTIEAAHENAQRHRQLSVT